MSDQTSWKLLLGCHRGTMMSRDNQVVTHNKERKPLKSLDDCILTALEWKSTYMSSGSFLWYATAVEPDGTKHQNIIPGTSYS